MKTLMGFLISFLALASVPAFQHHSQSEGPGANSGAATSATTHDVQSVLVLDGVKYTTLQSIMTAAQAAGGARIIIPHGNYSVSTNLFDGISVPIDLDFAGPSEVDLTTTQTIASNNVSIRFPGQNPAIIEIASAAKEAPQTPGLRFKATAALGGPMFAVAGPIIGFNLSNVHFDCNGNATMAVSADRMQVSNWTGIVSADNCSTMGFQFPNQARGKNQDTAFNNIGTLFVTRSPACVEFDQNSSATSNFAHNVIQEVACSLLGTSGATDEIYFQGADGNVIQRVFCQIHRGTGTTKSCVHFSTASYQNYIGEMDPGIPSAPAIIQDGPNNYSNYVANIGLGNWLSAGGNSVGNQVTTTGRYPRIIWTDNHLNLSPSLGINFVEGPPPSSFSSTDMCYGDASVHGVKCSYNKGNFHPLYLEEAGSCSMESATTCTFAIGGSFSAVVGTFVSLDAASAPPVSPIAANCSVGGTTVTITAGTPNSLTWDCLVKGK